MPLESGTFIQDLIQTNPPGTDLKSQGDDHLQLIKKCSRNTFPNATRAFYFPSQHPTTISANYSVVAADMNKVILVDTAGGPVNITMPVLTSADSGWKITLIKNVTNNPMFVFPPSGNIVSGSAVVAKARRNIPFVPFDVFWAYGSWWAERCLGVPTGTIIPMGVQTLPTGFESCNGQTLVVANYPEYAALNGGSGVVIDLRERMIVGFNDSGASQDRVNPVRSGMNPTVWQSAGGADAYAMPQNHLPNVSLIWNNGAGQSFSGTAAGTCPGQSFRLFHAGGNMIGGPVAFYSPDGTVQHDLVTDANSLSGGSCSGTVAVSGLTSTLSGSGAAQVNHQNMSPSIVARYAIAVE